MKKIETRVVEYYGVDIEIPAGHNFVATDNSGEVFSYACEPKQDADLGYWYPGDAMYDDCKELTLVSNEDCNWEESLREYPAAKE
ncbi:hypothetical protein LVJ85_05765 [Neisseria sp. Dent CA1/247]|uniref:hypothetical protein n=1 Tax=Neisseria sp. Dent CA1/247 TaxID=2912675 RepID=UPI001FD240D3|nr:hypothetical protein [Neisseria sp. Dent CA1/247]UOO77969.1 hypothetical protein LVJ85_05765 [Neisseria sp. Dent CA1/247]